MNGHFHSPTPINEPVFSYAPGTPERIALKKKVADMAAEEIEIPILIGGKEVRTGNFGTTRRHHLHRAGSGGQGGPFRKSDHHPQGKGLNHA